MHVDAIKRPRNQQVDLTAALDASGVVGAWSWSSSPDRCILDAGAAAVLAGDPGLAGRPVPLETAKARVHPDDRPALFRHFRALSEHGGLLVAEYRTLSPTGEIRRILDRGRVSRGGRRREGHGIIIDITEAAPRDAAPSRALARALLDPGEALAAAVDHALECRDALERIEDSELRLLIDMLLLRLGQKAARLSAGGLTPGFGVRRDH